MTELLSAVRSTAEQVESWLDCDTGEWLATATPPPEPDPAEPDLGIAPDAPGCAFSGFRATKGLFELRFPALISCFGLVLLCSLRLKSFLTACGLAAPEIRKPFSDEILSKLPTTFFKTYQTCLRFERWLPATWRSSNLSCVSLMMYCLMLKVWD